MRCKYAANTLHICSGDCALGIPGTKYNLVTLQNGMSAAANPEASIRSNPYASKYRPEIDGLRAFAVVAVIINHFNKDLLPSGYLGVDIFFVISGYVITSSLAGRQSTNFLDFVTGFYERRIKRLVPALAVLLVATSVLLCLFSPDPGIMLGIGWRAMLGFSNVELYKQSTDYFTQSTELNPFTHTWSLGVEEQFYLLFPFLIWFSGFGQQQAKGARNLFFWVGALTIASLIGFIYLYQVNQPAAYFLMPPRFWEMAAGCLIFIGFHKRASIEEALEQAPPLLVVAAMVGVMFLPVSAAVPATIGIVVLSAVLIACLKSGTVTYKFFTFEKVVFVGLISYSLYLWHWTVLSISRWTIGIHWWSVPLQVILIFLLAFGSYYLIEKPLRKSKWSSIRAGSIGLGVGTAFFASIFILTLDRFFRGFLFAGEKTSSSASSDLAPLEKSCQEYLKDVAVKCKVPPRNANLKRILLMGDSHSLHLNPLLGKLNNITGIGVSGLMTYAQAFPPVRYTTISRTAKTWESSNREAQRFFDNSYKEMGAGDIVLFSSRLDFYFVKDKKNIGEKNTVTNLASPLWEKIEEHSALSYWSEEIKKIAVDAQSKDINIIVVAPIPVFKGGSAPIAICLKQWFRPTVEKDCGADFAESRILLEKRFRKINAVLETLASSQSNIYIYRPFDTLCPNFEKTCKAVMGNRQVFKDDDHLSREGALHLFDDFLEFLDKKNLI